MCVDSRLYAVVLHRLGSTQRIEEMEAVGKECESNCKATTATFTVQIAAYKKVGNLDGALHTWRRMEKSGLKPSSSAFSAIIDVFASFKLYEEAADTYLLSLWEGLYPNVTTLSIFIHHLALAGKMNSAMAIFNDMCKMRIKPKLWTYASLMQGYAGPGDIDAIVKLVRNLKDIGLRPHRARFRKLFRDLIREQRQEDALLIMKEMWPEFSSKDLRDLIHHYQDVLRNEEQHCESSMSETSDSSDDENGDNSSKILSSDSPLLWNFDGFVRHLNSWSVTTALALGNAKIKWNSFIVSEMIKRINRVDVAWKFFIWVEGQQGFTHDELTYTEMMSLLSNEGNIATVKQILVELQSRQLNLPLSIYNKVLQMCAVKKDGDFAIDVFNHLCSAGLEPDVMTYEQLIHALYECGSYWQAATVLEEREKVGFLPTARSYSYVICGLAEAGQIEYAKAYYFKMHDRKFEFLDQIFSAFIYGFCKIGKLQKAEQLLEQMRNAGMQPSEKIYNMMVQAFKQAGKKIELCKIEPQRKVPLPSKSLIKQQKFEACLRVYGAFKDSFAESDDMQLYATG
ncbi:hypothetical protein KP509_01G061400 [Ceratopteris richardii]|nr:hypothetical protein KP509_01G061400 [Ceratopteris richardii]